MLINGRAYDWSMMNFTFSNFTGAIAGITKIAYNKERKIESVYGVGSEPIARGHGNNTYTGSVTITQNGIQELLAISPDGTLEGLGEFDIIIEFQHPTEGKTVVDTIKSCIYSEQGVDVSQDDTNIEKEYNLNPGGIEFGDSSVI